VHLDGCVEVEAAYNRAPPGWIGQRVAVHWNDPHVRVLDPRSGQLLREHLRTRRGHHRVDDADRPPRTPAKTLALLDRARAAGVAIGALCDHLHRISTPRSAAMACSVGAYGANSSRASVRSTKTETPASKNGASFRRTFWSPGSGLAPGYSPAASVLPGTMYELAMGGCMR